MEKAEHVNVEVEETISAPAPEVLPHSTEETTKWSRGGNVYHVSPQTIILTGTEQEAMKKVGKSMKSARAPVVTHHNTHMEVSSGDYGEEKSSKHRDDSDALFGIFPFILGGLGVYLFYKLRRRHRERRSFFSSQRFDETESARRRRNDEAGSPPRRKHDGTEASDDDEEVAPTRSKNKSRRRQEDQRKPRICKNPNHRHRDEDRCVRCDGRRRSSQDSIFC